MRVDVESRRFKEGEGERADYADMSASVNVGFRMTGAASASWVHEDAEAGELCPSTSRSINESTRTGQNRRREEG